MYGLFLLDTQKYNHSQVEQFEKNQDSYIGISLLGANVLEALNKGRLSL